MKKIFLLVIFLLINCSTSYSAKNSDKYIELDKYYPISSGNKWVYDSSLNMPIIVKITECNDDICILKTENALLTFYEVVQRLGDKVVTIARKGGINSDGQWEKLIVPEIILRYPIRIGKNMV